MLVLLPGLQGSGVFFDPFTSVAAGKMDCRVISYPDAPPMGYDALEKFVTPLLPKEDYFLVADSFGGPLCVTLASRGDSFLKGIVLAATFIRNPLHKSLIPAARLALQTIGKVTPPDAVLRSVLFDRRSDHLLDMTRERIKELDEATLLARCNAALGIDRSAELASFKKPVLIMAARHDRLIHKSAAQEMKMLAPHATYAEFEAPHFLLQSAPEDCLTVISEFVETAA